MPKRCSVALSLLSAWLFGWIVFSWGAVQDDAFIHLRYADNLRLHHFITYDGVHANYGASSLLYVSLLAVLRVMTHSPDLPRAASSVIHLLTFAGLAVLFVRISISEPRQDSARVGEVLAFTLLCLLSAPSAVRWLDDGMETGLGILFVCLLAWLIHEELGARRTTGLRYKLLAGVAFLAVFLRVELLMLCALGFAILTVNRLRARDGWSSWTNGSPAAAVLRSGHLLLGSAAAIVTIVCLMRVVLPDTAIAKAHGIGAWWHPIHDTAITLGGAFSFGFGVLLFWLMTLFLVLIRGGRTVPTTLLANSLFPCLLAISSLRGQEIQGVRYFAWTLIFSSIWNILELLQMPLLGCEGKAESRLSRMLAYGFLGLLLMEMPMESAVMGRVFTHRRETLLAFESQHLGVLERRRGIASDVGYIGYFTKANLCDLAGLVNGRAAGMLKSEERAQACAATNPDFLFANVGQLGSMTTLMNLSDWQICGRYDLTNVKTPDSHYLVVRPSIAGEVCQATGWLPQRLRDNPQMKEAMSPVLARTAGL